MKHKWHKEIVAWAAGAEIEYWDAVANRWVLVIEMPYWNNDMEYRIKPKEPQYLYVYKSVAQGKIEYNLWHDENFGGALLGKIKLEQDDVSPG